MISKNKYLRFKNALGGKRLFLAIVTLFGLYAAAIALSSGYPLPYDEFYHFTLIQHYSEQFSPFIGSQPAELSVVGDATRLGSYLMHYLLSFPLRITELFTSSTAIQVAVLRLINVAFVVAAIVLLRRFVFTLTKSGHMANGLAVVFCLLPVTSLLAAHINYDNLLLLCFAALLVMAQSVVLDSKKHASVSLVRVLSFVSVTLLACLVKFAFLPIAATILAFVAARMIRSKMIPAVRPLVSFNAKAALVVSVLVCIGAVGLVAERYGGNTLTYGTPQPDCDKVQPLSVCMQYGPWARNHNLELAAASDTAFEARPAHSYVARIWAPLMIRGLGGVNEKGAVPGIASPVLLSLLIGSVVVVAGVLGALVMYRKNSLLVMIVAATVIYGAVLLQRNYSEYVAFHEVVAVQGRYMVPFIIPILAIGCMGFGIYARKFTRLGRRALREVKTLQTLEPREAYDRSVGYWSDRIWQRSTDS